MSSAKTTALVKSLSRLSDKREIKGRIIGVDPATDIALLKVDVSGLPFVPWGDSDGLKVGEWVLAIGSPFQLSQTVTAGIVSATGRANVGFADYEDFIQTDAAINPGNSGGALINSRGELIGINTGIFSQSGGYQGIGFAVPSKLARHVIDDLMKFGAVQRGTIGGISVDRLTPQLAEEVGAPRHQRRGGRADAAERRSLQCRHSAWRRHRRIQWPAGRRPVAALSIRRGCAGRIHRGGQRVAQRPQG